MNQSSIASIRSLSKQALFWLVAALGVVVVLVPIIWIVSTSLKPPSEVFAIPPSLFPAQPTLQNFDAVLGNPTMLDYFRNSLIAAGGATAISMVLGVPAAYGFAKYRSRSTGVLLGAVLVTRMFPPVALSLPFFLQFRVLGLIDTNLALVIAYVPVVLPLVIWMMEGFFRDIPDEIIEAARIDGLGVPGILIRIVVPIAAPAISVAMLFGFLAAWNEFVLALSLTSTPRAQTMPVGIAGYITQFQTHWGAMTAASVIYLVPVLVLTVLAQKRIISGLTAGATKG